MEEGQNKSIINRTHIVWIVVLGAILIDQIIKITVKLSMYLHEGFAVCGDWFYIYFSRCK